MTNVLERQRPEACLSDLALDRLVMGEIDRRAPAVAHLDTCETCRARLAELEAASRPFMSDGPARRMPAPRARRRWAWVGAGATLASAAAVALWLRPAEERTRLKGGPVLEVIAKHGDGRVESIAPGATLAPNDAIRFRLSTQAAAYVSVIGLDAAGHVTAYAPASGPALALPAGAGQLLDGSVILDDTPGAERIVALVCERPMDVAAVVAAGQRALADSRRDPRKVNAALGFSCPYATTWYQKLTR